MNLDLVVLGAGAVGLSLARRAAAAGAAVLVVDPRSTAGGASLGNAGLVAPSHIVPLAAPGMVALGFRYLLDPAGPFRLTPRMDPALWGWLWRFARSCTRSNVERGLPVLRDLLRESRALVEAEAATLAPFGFEARGLLLAANTARGREELRREAELACRHDVQARMVAAGEVDPALSPLGESAFFPGDAHLDPGAYCGALAADLESRGGRILQAEARALHPCAGGWRVETTGGDFQAGACAVAAGAWSATLLRPLGLRLPLEAGRGCSLTYPNHPTAFRSPFILHEARVAVTPMAGGLRLAGTMELSGLDETLAEPRLQALEHAFRRALPDQPLPPREGAAPWAGLRPCSPDGLPYLGWARPGLLVATGHAMLGISLAAVTGELGARLLRGESPGLDLEALDPKRFE